MSELKKGQIAGPSRALEGTRGFVRRYIWRDGTDHK
jgi:hypothetical protein